MKCFILFFLLTISTAFSQSENKNIPILNPDGEMISFHVSPYFTTGKIFGLELQPTFCVKLELIAPLANTVSLKLFYDYTNTVYDDKKHLIFNEEVPIQLNKIGATFSFYLE